MIPIPSKKPFGHPLPAEALLYLVDPMPGHEFAQPFLDASGNAVTWNGALAVRIRSALPADLDYSAKPWEAVENSLRWPDPDAKEDPARWKLLDDDAGRIWKFKPSPTWLACRDEHGRPSVTGNKLASVRVGAATIVPLCLLQLAARLPRCRVRIDGQRTGQLQLLWRGGEAVINHVEDLPEPRFGILTPKTDIWTRDFSY